MMDFTRDKDGMFNETVNFLALPHLTYDVYSVTGQGTAGSFRPFRNDYGSVFDPRVTSSGMDLNIGAELGIGGYFEGGTDVAVTESKTISGPWDAKKRSFTKKQVGSSYENIYFKNAGELSQTNASQYQLLNGEQLLSNQYVADLPNQKTNSNNVRDSRANLVSFLTNEEAGLNYAAIEKEIQNYKNNINLNEWITGNQYEVIDREDNQHRKGHHFSEFTQMKTDGTRYVYGISALNNYQEERVFSVSKPSSDDNGIMTYETNDDSPSNSKGIDNYFNRTRTPAHAHSYLLTAILSSDYVDVTGDGLSEDDLGSYTKFNYNRKQSNYGWRAPYGQNKAQYNEGMKSDLYDDKASYIKGEREQWYLHSIETKNAIAFFYTSERDDARGVNKMDDKSYKLDSIKHFNKNDFLLNGHTAMPIKSVFFEYNYELSKGVPNQIQDNNGKLTLKKIFIQHGSSERNLLNPYKFNYFSEGYDYKEGISNRWGDYQPAGSPFGKTHKFPFVNQTLTQDINSKAWSLKDVYLPSGGKITIDYESDDYAFVQDKVAMEMLPISGFGNNKNFTAGLELYKNKYNSNNYLYFKRKKDKELDGVPFKDNYWGDDSVLYTNVSITVAPNKQEHIKAFVSLIDIGICPNDDDYGYIQLKPITPKGNPHLSVQPISYIGINFARYYLPHVIYPGSDPDVSNLQNVLKGLLYSHLELIKAFTNPVVQLLELKKLRFVDLKESYVRLQSPGMQKKGGGQRVKEIKFYDSWDKISEHHEYESTYGKRYEYTRLHNNGKTMISSGVASYEPLIGGDENPFRLPDEYIVQKGGIFPPHDPVGLYMEMPMGESLFPGPVVGYSEVREYSIHRDYAKSAQTLNVHKFYTAKDFPLSSKHSDLYYTKRTNSFSILNQFINYEASQHYTLVFNDMHGKPMRQESYKLLGNNNKELLSYTHYKYFSDGNQLVNDIPVLKTDPVTRKVIKSHEQLGIEVDFTHDVRERLQYSTTQSLYANLNVLTIGIPPIPIPIPYVYGAVFSFDNKFRSQVSTKVIQKYGILKEIEHFNQGALTVVRNEAFDPLTGQALVTSTNNEYLDRIYSTQIPAYWTENRMGPSYLNIGYTDRYSSLAYDNGEISLPVGNKITNYQYGDELILKFNANGETISDKFWVTGLGFSRQLNKSICGYCFEKYGNSSNNNPIDCPIEFGEETYVILEPRNNMEGLWATSQTLNNVQIKNVRSGYRNQLTSSVQEVKSLDNPFENNVLKEVFDSVLDARAMIYSDQTTRQPFSLVNGENWFDRINKYVTAERGNFRVKEEYIPKKNRNYSTNNRTSGTYSLPSFWIIGDHSQMALDSLIECGGENTYNIPDLSALQLFFDLVQNKMVPQNISNLEYWIKIREVTITLPTGEEVENKNPLDIYSTVHFSQPSRLPKLVANNAKYEEVLYESFEDYKTFMIESPHYLVPLSPFMKFNQNLVQGKFILADTSLENNAKIVKEHAHTGHSSLKTGSIPYILNIPIKTINTVLSSTTMLPFLFLSEKEYIVQYWVKPVTNSGAEITYKSVGIDAEPISPIIEGWQLMEKKVVIPSGVTAIDLQLPTAHYVDDLRVFPIGANMKTYVYHPINQRVMASLNEAHFATFYEYDEEGNLVRTKKETERGIITLSENRQSHSKH